MIKTKSNIFILAFILILVFKIIVAGLFSSEYQDELFIPFVNLFVSGHYNPWEYVYQNNLNLEFPYHPLMLYFESFGMIIIKLFNIKSFFLTNIIFKLPIFVADIGIFYLLLKIFKDKPYQVTFYYFLSPIIIYASYMHSQLDLLPTAFLFTACCYLRKFKIIKAAILFAISLCTKFTAILVLPIIFAYIYRNYKFLKAIIFISIVTGIYFIISIPFIFSEGYQNLVLMNVKQNLFFDSIIQLGDVGIYVSLCFVVLMYFRIFVYKRINVELLDSYIVMSLAVILLLIPPSTPAWYIWLIPFLSIFIIRYCSKDNIIIVGTIMLNIVYLLYFVPLHIGDFADLYFLSYPINLKLSNIFLKNFIYTCLLTILLSSIYMVYKVGIKNNNVYKPNKAITIGIGGDSGAGKTSLSTQLNNILGNNIISMEGDGCHKWERNDKNWDNYTHLDPKANFLYTQLAEIIQLKNYKSVYHSDYNHTTGKFDTPSKISPKQFVILSGLHPFYLPKMRKIIDIKIYLNPDERLRKYWKIQRDTKNRNYSADEVLDSILKREEDANKYIIPQKKFADLIIEFFPNEDFDFSTTKEEPELNLKISLNSNIDINNFINYLNENSINNNWDYSDDLSSQYFILNNSYPSNISLDFLIKDDISYLKEILKKEIKLSEGFNGVIEFIILKLIIERLKEIYD